MALINIGVTDNPLWKGAAAECCKVCSRREEHQIGFVADIVVADYRSKIPVLCDFRVMIGNISQKTVAVAFTGVCAAVGVGCLGVAVGATSASAASELVGNGTDGGGPLHPTNNTRIAPMPIVCCNNLRMLMLPSFSLDAYECSI